MASNGEDDFKDSLYSTSARSTYYNSFAWLVINDVQKRRREVPEDSRQPFTGRTPCSSVADTGSQVSELDNQLETCTCLAFEKLDISLEDIEGVDCNGFDLEDFRENDDMIYFHAVFKGTKPGETAPRYYFAELTGAKEPEQVTTVVEMYQGDFTTENCVFCQGIWHPCAGGFKGHNNNGWR